MKYVLITGGCGGIGAAVAERFAKEGFHLFLVSNNLSGLKETKEHITNQNEVQVETLHIDLIESDAPAKVYQEAIARNLNIEVLVNNAGFGTCGFYDDISIEKELKMIDLNIKTVYHLTRLFLHDMKTANKGHIINISSISAFQPNPKMAAYGATKSFVLNYSLALNEELKIKGSKVRVSSICPPPVNTGFAEGANMQDAKLFNGWMVATTEDVANSSWKAYENKKAMLVPRTFMHILSTVARRLPTSILMKLSYKELKN